MIYLKMIDLYLNLLDQVAGLRSKCLNDCAYHNNYA